MVCGGSFPSAQWSGGGVVEEEEPMGAVLDVDVPQKVFNRRIHPFGIALAQVSWRVKMFTHDGSCWRQFILKSRISLLPCPFGLMRRRLDGVFSKAHLRLVCVQTMTRLVGYVLRLS